MTDPLRALGPVVRLAPAKLNLTLAVVGRRSDGYHELHSVMVPLGLVDRLSLAVLPAGHDSLHVAGRPIGRPADNLVLRAIRAARGAVTAADPRNPVPSLAARLEKRIPVAAGLGGGSSDAAAALEGALEAWGAGLADVERLRLAAGLGSDVPFFLAGAPALVEGRGERVTPLPGPAGEPPGILLVTPAVPIRTPDVFAAYDGGARPAAGSGARAASEHLAAELRGRLQARRLLDRAGILAAANDLTAAAAAVVPELVPFRRRLTRLLARPVGQTGSGPSLWVLYPSEGAAAAAADEVRAALDDGRLVAPGDEPPFIAATTIAAGATVPAAAGRPEEGGTIA